MPVPRFEPFRALRYRPDLDLDLVTAPPYDVLSADDVAALRARHPRNVVAVDVPEPAADRDRYAEAARILRSWRADGTLAADPAPSYTLYRMRFHDEAGAPRSTVGVVGALEVVDAGGGGVLPHERTTPKASTDRLDLTRATAANLSPVWGLSLTPGLTELLDEPGDELGRCTDPAGVVHTVERVTDGARVAAIGEAVGASPVLIADGHHRYAISRTYRDERRAQDGAGPWDLTLAYVGELVADQLAIDAIHRLYRGIGARELLAELARSFRTEPAGPVDATFAREAVRRGALCLVDREGSGTWLVPEPSAFPGVRDLDGALLEHALTGVSGDGGQVEVSYQHGVTEVLHELRAGRADAAVLIRPTGIAEIRRTADEGLLMPPKSTFFTPKLRTGLVLRSLEPDLAAP